MTVDGIGSIGICIDNYAEGSLSGRLITPLRDSALVFSGAIGLIKLVNELLEEAGRPQATMTFRSFRDNRGHQAGSRKPVATPSFERLQESFKGDKATLVLMIRYRQNASWQGQVRWLEADKEEHFRSLMELLLLIDSIFTGVVE